MLCVLFFCVFLWEIEQLRDSLGRFFSHRTHRFNRTICALFRTHRGPSAYREHRALLLTLGWKLWEVRRSRTIRNPYNLPSWPPSIHADIIAYNRRCNPQEISVLCLAFENMPFLLQEGRLQRARRACSRMMKGILLFQARPFLGERGVWQLKYIDNSCLKV